MNTPNNDDIQGRLFGMPYDFRVPSFAKAGRRLYQPGGPVLVPKLFGWGWSFNYARPESWLLSALVIAGIAGIALAYAG